MKVLETFASFCLYLSLPEPSSVPQWGIQLETLEVEWRPNSILCVILLPLPILLGSFQVSSIYFLKIL